MCTGQDFNNDPLRTEGGRRARAVRMTEIRYVEGLYRNVDELLVAIRAWSSTVAPAAACGSISRQSPVDRFLRSDFAYMHGASYGRAGRSAASRNRRLVRLVPLHSESVMAFTPYEFRRRCRGRGDLPDIRRKGIPVRSSTPAVEELKRLRPFFLATSMRSCR